MKLTRRDFVKTGLAAGAVGMMPAGLWSATPVCDRRVKVLVIGGGAAGISVAVRLKPKLPNAEITIVDPAEKHFYQPGFTFIGAGIWKPDAVWMREEDLIPKGVTWVQDAVLSLLPDKNTAITRGGKRLDYDFLVLAPGLQENWSLVQGLTRETLGVGNVHSIYDFEGSVSTWRALDAFAAHGGRALFTDTWTKLKCGGAPKKMCLLTEHLMRKRGTRAALDVAYFTASKELYDVPHYTPRLEEIYRERNIPVTLNAKLTGVDVQAKKAFFEDRKTGRTWHESYDFLHLAPPQSAPDFVREAGLGWTEGKLAREAWAMADKETLFHKKYANIICVGDVAGIPTSKTSAAIRKQAPIAAANLLAVIAGGAPEVRYDGYAACPIITDYGHVLMAEFDYDKNPSPTPPFTLFDTRRELRSAWYLKRYVLKPLYFRLMLRGLA